MAEGHGRSPEGLRSTPASFRPKGTIVQVSHAFSIGAAQLFASLFVFGEQHGMTGLEDGSSAPGGVSEVWRRWGPRAA